MEFCHPWVASHGTAAGHYPFVDFPLLSSSWNGLASIARFQRNQPRRERFLPLHLPADLVQSCCEQIEPVQRFHHLKHVW